MWDDERKPGIGDKLIQGITRFEEGTDGKPLEWLGGTAGLVVGIVLSIPAAAVTVFGLLVMFGLGDHFAGSKLVVLVMLMVLMAMIAYWRRQRLAAHFEAANRRVRSDDPGQRQRGLTDFIMNARRGRAEHHRIAGALAAYLRRPPHDHPEEAGRRQLAFSLLADQTLSMSAKQRLDLSGASLAGLRAINAELPGVCLRGADLGNVRFVRANLRQADLEGARIDGADFTGATLDGTILAGAAPPRR